ncbi:Uncharacterized conserved protein YbjT, contains NAD(P)-binding and DUF2867 domains [Marininema mesophilum]|uniref:Uncharacterized conserved protein YbjT, contains NAD(P)-binding and DUF2867 domains n=1 Tax=Marininema mesophilum TaxID=1048340 RepID=A0A1H2Y0J9_9BACL|nr:oxidoreductase [Marininema mesophilum]SDW98677.1 Uncharacterized conserved protein YbjT, contains NAD(P)-binding and DUF2867 domains [Marininema mesophilum]
MTQKHAMVAGASGLVGSNLVPLLLESPAYNKVTLLLRRELPIHHPKLVQCIVNFDYLEEEDLSFPAEDVFCCLGTTIKIAKTQEAFRRVDLEYPLAIARLAKQHQTKRFLIITAVGSDPHSLFFYNRVKGELEASLRRLHFPALHILHPSLLLGERKEKRAGELFAGKWMPRLSPIMQGPLKKYRAIHSNTVAKAMFTIAQSEAQGVAIYESDELMRIASTIQMKG